jgi:hypothetical protein
VSSILSVLIGIAWLPVDQSCCNRIQDRSGCNRFCALLRFSRKSNSYTPAATKQPAAQITKSLSIPFAQKYSASVVGQISDPNPPVPPDKRGVAHVTKRAVGCGGREDGGDERLNSRTAKSCGPDAPMLASSFR